VTIAEITVLGYQDHVVRIRERGNRRILGFGAIEDPVDVDGVHAPLPKPVHQPVG